jgi:Tfp pilus assembly protein PilO
MPAVQVSLTLVLSLFVMAIFIVFALRPTVVTIVTLKKTIVESEKTLQQLSSNMTNLQKASVQFELLKPVLPMLNLTIPNNGAGYSPLTTAIEILARQTGTQLESESLGPTLLFSRIISPFIPSKGQSVVELPFTARVIGSYPNVSAFLTKLLSMERIILIDSVTITRETGAKEVSASVALNISGSAYYLAEAAQLEKSIVKKE